MTKLNNGNYRTTFHSVTCLTTALITGLLFRIPCYRSTVFCNINTAVHLKKTVHTRGANRYPLHNTSIEINKLLSPHSHIPQLCKIWTDINLNYKQKFPTLQKAYCYFRIVTATRHTDTNKFVYHSGHCPSSGTHFLCTTFRH